MSRFKLLGHDLRCGLLRKRYLVSTLLFAIPCFVFTRYLHVNGIHGSWMDYMLSLFRGVEPTLWLLVTSSCLFINLDYLMKDLTNAGLQIIIRSKNRTYWYLSKCVWNLGSCIIYFLAAGVTCAIFALATDGQLSAQNTPELSVMLFGLGISEELMLTPLHALLASCVLPFLTIFALSMLQMTLCLFIKPVISFIVCFCQLSLSIWLDYAFVLGNGAITSRSGFVVENGISPTVSAVVAIVVIITSTIIGCVRFQRTGIINLEE